MSSTLSSVSQNATEALDIRPDLERDEEPFARIMAAAARVPAGRFFVVIAPFEPAPLYSVLGAQGFTYQTECVAPDEWIVRFTRA